jgi:hypothetical protein
MKHQLLKKNKKLTQIKYRTRQFQLILIRKKKLQKSFHAGTVINYISKVRKQKNSIFLWVEHPHFKTPNRFAMKFVSKNIKMQIMKNVLLKNVKKHF